MKKYKLSVPVVNLNFFSGMNREKTVEVLKQMGAERVFLAISSNPLEEDKKENELNALRENTEFLHRYGFEVGAWLWAFLSDNSDYQKMVAPDGTASNNVTCPTDKKYRRALFSFICDCAKTGIDLIMFDDDYRYGFHDMGFGCLCENHCEMIRNIIGENASRETIAQGILKGGRNKYRDAFLKANGMALEDFAKDCRQNLDKVNPRIRLGFCSCITSWDIDGTTPDRIAQIFAGNTKPFYRLIGAPYWAALNLWGHSRLSYVIEQERLEASRRADENIEIFSEGDTFPRPRHRVPSAYLEGLDTVLRADGCTDGILKYSFDYAGDYDYEPYYNDNHIRNIPMYKKIDEFFGDKKSVGVRVFDNAAKFHDITMPTDENNPMAVQELAFSSSARFLASNSIPAVYCGNEYGGIAFGEDAKILTKRDLANGIILDFPAAKILSDKGIDTGILGKDKTVEVVGNEFYSDGTKTGQLSSLKLHKFRLSEKAQVQSFAKDGEETIPVCYRFENQNGQRFLVYTFEGYSAQEDCFRNYKRQQQIITAVPWLCGKNLPVSCAGHPDLYILAKRKGNILSTGLWNFFPDKIYSPEIVFEKEIKSAKIYGAQGSFEKNVLTLTHIDSYGFAAAEIEFTD